MGFLPLAILVLALAVSILALYLVLLRRRTRSKTQPAPIEEATMQPLYEEQFTAFVDFLGFSEASTKTDDATRLKVLNLLLSLSALRGEFDVKSTTAESGTTSLITPAVTTFSDHIVISYRIGAVAAGTGSSERTTAFVIMNHFERLLSRIAAAALQVGFLVRGGATIGRLFHERGVVFGEAMVEAFELVRSP